MMTETPRYGVVLMYQQADGSYLCRVDGWAFERSYPIRNQCLPYLNLRTFSWRPQEQFRTLPFTSLAEASESDELENNKTLMVQRSTNGTKTFKFVIIRTKKGKIVYSTIDKMADLTSYQKVPVQ